MSEEEKSKLTAEQTEAIKRADAAEARAAALEDTYNKDKKSSLETLKNKIIKEKSGGDAELKKQLEANWEMINLEGSDEETFHRRGELAFNMLGIGKPKVSPFNKLPNGEAPDLKGEKFTDTEKGKSAEATLNNVLGIKN